MSISQLPQYSKEACDLRVSQVAALLAQRPGVLGASVRWESKSIPATTWERWIRYDPPNCRHYAKITPVSHTHVSVDVFRSGAVIGTMVKREGHIRHIAEAIAFMANRRANG